MNLKKTAIILVVFATIFIVWEYQKFTKISLSCEEPITYVIGTFDRRFGLSQKDFLDTLSEAEAIWEDSSDVELFAYRPEGGEMTVNLIYDYRQEVTNSLSDLEDVVVENEATYKVMQTRYVGLKTEYNSSKSIYDERILMFNENNAIYQSRVESWDTGKRVSREQFDELEGEREALEIEVAELKILERQLNEIAREINALVVTLNHLANSLNLDVQRYNTVGASRGESFTGGVYHSAEEVREINVYEFSNRDKLVRILAHELGHALGLEHVDDSKAIMYYLNNSAVRILSKTDLAAMRALCRLK